MLDKRSFDLPGAYMDSDMFKRNSAVSVAIEPVADLKITKSDGQMFSEYGTMDSLWYRYL